MRRIVAICCFCERVRADVESEEDEAPWQEFTSYMVNHRLSPEKVMFSHTYCPTCLVSYRTLLGLSEGAIPPDKSERKGAL